MPRSSPPNSCFEPFSIPGTDEIPADGKHQWPVVAAVPGPTVPWTPMAVQLGEVDAAAQATEGSCFDGSAGKAAVVLLQLTKCCATT